LSRCVALAILDRVFQYSAHAHVHNVNLPRHPVVALLRASALRLLP